jgi:hypothetical protein
LSKFTALLFEKEKAMSKKRPPDIGDREERVHKAYERLGTRTPSCIICGETSPLRLRLHHPAQHGFDADETVIICSSDHDDASDWQRDHPGKIEGCRSALEPIGHMLLGIGDLAYIAAHQRDIGTLKEFLLYIAETLRTLGRQLIELARSATIAAEGAL